jgi:hypothetical protein
MEYRFAFCAARFLRGEMRSKRLRGLVPVLKVVTGRTIKINVINVDKQPRIAVFLKGSSPVSLNTERLQVSRTLAARPVALKSAAQAECGSGL